MKIRLVSDLHLELESEEVFSLPALPDDGETVLMVAGDAGTHSNAYTFLREMTERFRAVIFVLGNNEHQHKNIHNTADNLLDWFAAYHQGVPANFHLLDRRDVLIDDTAFIGATLWTDLDQGGQWAVDAAAAFMPDYKFIYRDNADTLLTTDDTRRLHQRDLDYIASRVAYWSAKGKSVVVLSHHAPSLRSLSPKYAKDPLNPCFASDLSALPWLKQVSLWCHGHVHHNLDYVLENGVTGIRCNPRGRVGPFHAENPHFDPQLVITLP